MSFFGFCCCPLVIEKYKNSSGLTGHAETGGKLDLACGYSLLTLVVDSKTIALTSRAQFPHV